VSRGHESLPCVHTLLEGGPQALKLGGATPVFSILPGMTTARKAARKTTLIDPKKKERFAELVGLGCTQHDAGQSVGVQAPR
jgi:hypothetical protein